eukprot:2230744-Prymnesium_polylepis.1
MAVSGVVGYGPEQSIAPAKKEGGIRAGSLKETNLSNVRSITPPCARPPASSHVNEARGPRTLLCRVHACVCPVRRTHTFPVNTLREPD